MSSHPDQQAPVGDEFLLRIYPELSLEQARRFVEIREQAIIPDHNYWQMNFGGTWQLVPC